MRDSRIAKYFLIVLFVVFAYLAVITVMPIITSVILALILTFAFYPVYKLIQKTVKSKNLSAVIMIVLFLLIIIIPGGLIVNSLIGQSYSTYTTIQNTDFSVLNSYIPSFIKDNMSLDSLFGDIGLKVRDFVVGNVPNIIESIADILLGLFVMFFVMFYAFRDGDIWILKLEKRLPMKHEYTQRLLSNTESITKAVLYGYILTAAIQGTLGGLVFLILGIPNAVFWGFIMMIFAMIPFMGTPIIFVPAALIQLYAGNYFAGIFLLAFGFLVLINIDNFLRPKLISSKAKVHPAMVLVGVIGGLAVFGMVGILLGPMILTLFFVILKFFVLEFEV
ncbi:MAG: AI-2E family transporter [archaeon]